MGNAESSLSADDVHDYEELTFLSKNEIIRAHKRICNHIRKAGRDPAEPNALVLSPSDLRTLPEIMYSPFSERLIKVFSSRKDGSLTFEDYLDMLSVFSEAAPKSVKTAYAFKIYDFDNDELLSQADIVELIRRLTTTTDHGGLHDDERQQIVKYIFDEADLDENGYISLTEFELIVSKSPDFAKTFCIRIL